MVGQVLGHDAQRLTATARIDRNNPLLQDGRLPGHAGLELIAQASGLFLGLTFRGEARPGAIVTVRDMQVNVPWLDARNEITIETGLIGGDEAAAMFQGHVMVDGEVAVEATVMVSSFPEGEGG